MKTTTVANQKGGVGKTAYAVHLAVAIAEDKKRVMFLDVDTQGNSSGSIGMMYPHDSKVTASQLFTEDGIAEKLAINPDGITLVKADDELSDIETLGADAIRQFVNNMEQLKEHFDYCVIDTPPVFGLAVTSALIASDYSLAPIDCTKYSIDGISKLLTKIFNIRDTYNPDHQFLGMQINKFYSRSLKQKEYREELETDYSHLLIPACINLRPVINDSLEVGVPVWKTKTSSARIASQEIRASISYVLETMEG